MSSYRRGSDFERAVQDMLQSMRFYVVRAAGSHGKVDLAAFWPRDGVVITMRDSLPDFLMAGPRVPLFIQAKADGEMGPKERLGLLALADAYGAEAIKAWRPKRGEIRLERVRP